MIEPPPTVEPQFSQIWRNWLNNLFNHIAVEDSHIVGEANEPSFQNGWANYNSSTERPARFYKDPFGRVHLAGLVKDGTINTAIFTLPEGYRPDFPDSSSHHAIFSSVSSNAFCQINITNSYAVVCPNGNNTWVSLEGISFRASQ